MPRIEKTATPSLPQFVFEWHPWTQKVYVVELPGEWFDGQFVPGLSGERASAWAIAEHCEDHGRFLGAVQTWLRGYRKGRNNENVGTT